MPHSKVNSRTESWHYANKPRSKVSPSAPTMKLSKTAISLAFASLAVSVPMVDAGQRSLKSSKKNSGGSKSKSKKKTGGSDGGDGGNRVPTCNECTNIATPNMQTNEQTCTDLTYVFDRCKDKTKYWDDNKFCQFSCYKVGQGYDGDVCCDKVWTPKPTKAPTKSPTKAPTKAPTKSSTKAPTDPVDPDSCVGCTNKASPEMISNFHTCKTWPMTEDYCYAKPIDWRYYRYCAQSCSDLGLPYEYMMGSKCCTDGDDINRADDDYPQLAFGDDDELLADCRGDCDSSDDCESGLVCYQRSGFDAMPGCKGEPHYDTDYCLDTTRNFNKLVFLGQKGPFGRCSGDSDSDSDCVGTLRCFQRDGEVNNVPGCPGRAVDNVDYCYEAS